MHKHPHSNPPTLRNRNALPTRNRKAVTDRNLVEYQLLFPGMGKIRFDCSLSTKLICDTTKPRSCIFASGIPVYRLITQLRIGNGLFDMVSSIIYKGVPNVYVSLCNITAQFDSGGALEAFIQEEYPTIITQAISILSTQGHYHRPTILDNRYSSRP